MHEKTCNFDEIQFTTTNESQMNRIISFLFLITLSLLYTGCSKDDDGGSPAGCTGAAFNQRFADEINAISTASMAYSQNPSTANCEAFKAAYLDYIDELERYENCAIQFNQGTEWQQALDDARVGAMGIVC